MTYNRNIFDLSKFTSNIDSLIALANKITKDNSLEDGHYFQKESHNHPTAIIKHDVDGRFEAIPNKFIRKTPKILCEFKKLERVLGIDDLILSRYITRFQCGDFLKWRKLEHDTIGKILSISTTECHISFRNEKIILPAYRAISFDQADTYSITDVEQMENWIVFMIPRNSNPLENYEIHF